MTRLPPTLYSVSEGVGTDGLVFVHGFTCSLDDWDAQARYFRDHLHVLRCDLRGHGRSPGAIAECDPMVYGADVAALVDTHALRRVVLVGHSMGCRVALQAALELEDRVRGVVLVDGSYRATPDPKAAIRQAIERAGSFEAHIRRQFGTMFVHETTRSRRIIDRALAMPPDLAEALYARMTAWDGERLESALTQLHVPLLLIQSSAVQPDGLRKSLRPGDVVPWIEFVRARVAQMDAQIVPDVGHFTMIDAPDVVNRHIEAFVANVLRTAAS